MAISIFYKKFFVFSISDTTYSLFQGHRLAV